MFAGIQYTVQRVQRKFSNSREEKINLFFYPSLNDTLGEFQNPLQARKITEMDDYHVL